MAPGNERESVRLQVVLPDGWWAVPLSDPDRASASVRRLVADQFTGVDDQPLLRRDVERVLLEQVRDAADLGAHRLALSFQVAGGVPLAASLLEHHLGAVDLDELRAELVEEGGTAAAEMQPGRVLRRVRTTDTTDPALVTEPQPGLNVDYWVEHAVTRQVALLAFATPMVELKEPLMDLFDAVVTTGRWRSA